MFFPQLVAGPIVHPREMLPQFLVLGYKIRWSNLAVGVTMFVAGLFKKLVIADNIAPFANAVFDGVHDGVQVEFFEAWAGAIAFGMQLYFDFSAYSDMATGLARMFGIRLPINFFSPYKAVSIVDFWRRWHITLSRFLRDLVYIPLGGNRKGPRRRYVNLMVTMLLGGLWHGAGWTFVLWGGLHGICLALTHFMGGLQRMYFSWLRIPRFLAVGFTFAVVNAIWVPFRASGMEATVSMWKAMFGFHGISIPPSLSGPLSGIPFLRFDGLHSGLLVDMRQLVVWCALTMAIVFFMPNVYELMRRYRPTITRPPAVAASKLTWRPTVWWALGLAATVFAVSIWGVGASLIFCTINSDE